MKNRTLTASLIITFLTLISVITGCAPVTISSIPAGAGVYTKGSNDLIGKTPLKINLVANDKEVVVRKNGYFSKSLILTPTDPENITVLLAECQKVLLLSKPVGAEVFIKGENESIGRTPYALDYSRPERTFELRYEGYSPLTTTLPADPESDVTVELDREPFVTINSNPKRVSIYTTAGALLGVTPVEVLATDNINLEAKKDGYYPTKITIGPESESEEMVELSREPIVIIYSDPAEATVSEGGIVVGSTPYRKLIEKDTEFEIAADRYYPQTIEVSPSSARQVRLTLEKKPYIMIDSDPTGATLYRSGGIELIGTTPVEMFIDEMSELEIQMEGYQIKRFTLSPDSEESVTVPLQQGGSEMLAASIMIDSDPSGAKVFRPGGAELIGTTPLQLHVSAEKTLELQLDGYKNKIATIAPDSSKSVVFTMKKDGTPGDMIISDPLLNTPASF